MLLPMRCSVSETMVEAAGFSTTGPQPQPQHMHCRAIPCLLFDSIFNIATWDGGWVKGHVEIRHVMPSWECCALSSGMVFLEHRLSLTLTHRLHRCIPTTSGIETCTSINAHTHSHTYATYKIIFVRIVV